MNPIVRAIRNQLDAVDWTRPPEDIAADRAGFQLRDLADAKAIDELLEGVA